MVGRKKLSAEHLGPLETAIGSMSTCATSKFEHCSLTAAPPKRLLEAGLPPP
eukprot:CAMPEP_0183379616 /NCGR_PEP_ID=MMETSP0164_2-20130417/125517_1 /TAXON_ID=221442 /ORGANISM="Coccolithus pelagicus ssp braarudi, Strain PLY182g" /LENGTH=51 /DNA_ID=CAMNT_0025557201 /DNA_START=476 /DNA_END=631 /DNA_ORIENTATION=+